MCCPLRGNSLLLLFLLLSMLLLMTVMAMIVLLLLLLLLSLLLLLRAWVPRTVCTPTISHAHVQRQRCCCAVKGEACGEGGQQAAQPVWGLEELHGAAGHACG